MGLEIEVCSVFANREKSYIERLGHEPAGDWTDGLQGVALDLNRKNALLHAGTLRDPRRRFLSSVRVYWSNLDSMMCCELIPPRKYPEYGYDVLAHIKRLQHVMTSEQYRKLRAKNPVADIAVDQYLESFLLEAISK